MYLVALAVAAIILAFQEPLYHGLSDPQWVIAAAVAATLAPTAFAAGVTRRALRALDACPADPTYGQRLFGRGVAGTHTILAAAEAGLLLLTDWIPLCQRVPKVGQWVVVPSVLAVVPFLASAALVWAVLYPADRAVRQIAMEVHLFRGKPIRPVWPMRDYVLFNLRHQVLFILVPMYLILAARDVLEQHRSQLQRLVPGGYLADLLLGAATIIVAVIAPTILRYIWTTRRLPDSPLRERLVALCQKLRLRYREILVWRSGGMMVNAAVMGVLAPFRYILITDGMIEQLEDQKIEAVFGHEAGHVKRHHILFFLLYAVVSGCIMTIFSVRTQHWRGMSYQIAATVLGFVLAVKWGVLFGWLSRRFERQADVFGVRTLAMMGLSCAGPCEYHGGTVEGAGGEGGTGTDGRRHQGADEDGDEEVEGSRDQGVRRTARSWPDGSASTRSPAPLCVTAAHVFGDTLHEVAVLNGVPPEARSWRHGSIASRSRVLQGLARDSASVVRFERHLSYTKVAIFLVATAASLWSAYELKLWRIAELFRGHI